MRRTSRYRALLGAAMLVGLLAAPAQACRLALLLALDVSSSVDAVEDQLQRGGIATALLDPEVQDAFLAIPEAPVALAVFEWSGSRQQRTILKWLMIESRADLEEAAHIVASSNRAHPGFPTAMGYALRHAALLFREAPVCERKTIDISGDGVSNRGYGPQEAYRLNALGDVTVNALAVGGSVPLNYLMEYYRSQVLQGPGAFAIEARDYADFERAMKRKLILELSDRIVSDASGTRP